MKSLKFTWTFELHINSLDVTAAIDQVCLLWWMKYLNAIKRTFACFSYVESHLLRKKMSLSYFTYIFFDRNNGDQILSVSHNFDCICNVLGSGVQLCEHRDLYKLLIYCYNVELFKAPVQHNRRNIIRLWFMSWEMVLWHDVDCRLALKTTISCRRQ